MNQKHLLRFIKSKIKNHPDDVVIVRGGEQLTLAGVSGATLLNSGHFTLTKALIVTNTSCFNSTVVSEVGAESL